MKIVIPETALYVAIALLLFALVWSAYGLITPQQPSLSQQQFFAAEDKNNPCATPPGYSDQQWREHMSHHPDQYAQCLK